MITPLMAHLTESTAADPKPPPPPPRASRKLKDISASRLERGKVAGEAGGREGGSKWRTSKDRGSGAATAAARKGKEDEPPAKASKGSKANKQVQT